MFARCLSSLQSERVQASGELKGPATCKYQGDKKEFVEHVRKVIRIPCSVSIPSLEGDVKHFFFWGGGGIYT